MIIPGGCACGCDKPLKASEFWAEERCAQAWVRRVNGLPPLPPEKVGSSPLVAAAAAFATAYIAAVDAEFPQVASENPQVECGQPGWLGRAFGRLFGKGAA